MDIIALIYSLSGLIFGAAFITQVLTLIRDKEAVFSYSIFTWVIFSLCSVVTLSYVYKHDSDSYFVFCILFGAIGNVSFLLIILVRRLQAFFLK